MQAVLKNENKGSISRGVDSVGVVIYARRIGRHLEGEHTRESEGVVTRI